MASGECGCLRFGTWGALPSAAATLLGELNAVLFPSSRALAGGSGHLEDFESEWAASTLVATQAAGATRPCLYMFVFVVLGAITGVRRTLKQGNEVPVVSKSSHVYDCAA